MRSSMSFQAKKELLIQIAPRYQEANRREKTVILDAFVTATGYDRKYAIRLLSQPIPLPVTSIKRPRKRTYGKEVQEALIVTWKAVNEICAKRLVPFLPELVQSLENHGHLVLTDEIREQLLVISSGDHQGDAVGALQMRFANSYWSLAPLQ